MKALLATSIAFFLLASPASAMGTGECGCPGDVNADNSTDFGDVLDILTNWGNCEGCPQDLDADGLVGFGDVLIVLTDWGCGVPGPTTNIVGVITNSMTGDPIEGALVQVGPCELVTDVDGMFSGDYLPGLYDIVVSRTNFITDEQEIVLFPDFMTIHNVALDPVAPVIVTIVLDGDAAPGATLDATAVVDVFDDSTIQDYDWGQTVGALVQINPGVDNTATIDLANGIDYKAELIHHLMEPAVGPGELPSNVPPPPGEFPAGLQNRWQVVGVNPFALEEAGLVGIDVAVTTTSGVYVGVADIETHLAWRPAAGIRNVPIGRPVILHGKDQGTYDWAMMTPGGSSSVLLDAMTQNPEFTPDVPGLYTLTVTDELSDGPIDIFVFAGTWRGVIEGLDGEGVPIPETACLNCHVDGGVSTDQFTPWLVTGHANAFGDGLNTNSHWNPGCFECHTVGHDLDVANFGFDDGAEYGDFLASGLLGNPAPDNWMNMIDNYPTVARNAGIQCENCHGPQNGPEGVFSASHTQVLPRVSLSSDVCATCHGEPKRHARFQQWQLSGHANYEVAIDEGDSGNCSRCHTANGFLEWLPILTGEVPGDPLASITVDWTADETHPQTCVTCHDPHSSGTQSGNDNTATVRISGNTPPLIAGFTAYGVGRGAICMTCHNSRRGLHNEATWPDFVGTSETARAPHGSAQADMLMGENAFLVEVGDRGNHSFITDTCTNCHMKETPPPDVLSYNLSGTNHTFYASPDVCAECHGDAFQAEFIQGGVEENLDLLKGLIETGLVDVMDEQIMLGNTIDVNGLVTVTDVADIEAIEFTEYHGRQAIIVTVGGMDFGPATLNSVDVVDAGMVVQGALYDFADDNLPKAGWNWALVHNDGSLGVHNPSYAYEVLGASVEALSPGYMSLFKWPDWMDRGRD